MTDAKTAVRAKEYSIGTCDIDMLVSYHRFFDDTVIVDAAVRTCALDVAVEFPEDWLISLPLNLWVHEKMALNCNKKSSCEKTG